MLQHKSTRSERESLPLLDNSAKSAYVIGSLIDKLFSNASNILASKVEPHLPWLARVIAGISGGDNLATWCNDSIGIIIKWVACRNCVLYKKASWVESKTSMLPQLT